MSLFGAARPLFSKVAVLGAAGGIGQPLSLLLKVNPRVTGLSLYDIRDAPGVSKDLSHISTPAQCAGFLTEDLGKALQGADIVVIPAGVPRKPGMARDDLFNFNAKTVYTLIEGVAKNCPNAAICLITNPVNSTVPIAAEVLKRAGVYNPQTLFGVSTLDLVRAKTFVTDLKGIEYDVPVIGGHSGPTIVPLLSQVPAKFSEEEIKALSKRIQYAGDEVVEAKAGSGSATLSMAYAAVRFVDSLLRADAGEAVNEWAFVNTPAAEPTLDFFATSVQLGKGFKWTQVNKTPELSDWEKHLYSECVAQLTKDIQKGKEWAKAN